MIGKLTSVWWVLRIGLGLAAFLAGLDEFFDILTAGEGVPGYPAVLRNSNASTRA